MLAIKKREVVRLVDSCMPERVRRVQTKDRGVVENKDKMEPSKKVITLADFIGWAADRLKEVIDDERVVGLKRVIAD